jgi:membrane protease YdiL (CAAX protease family)
MSFQDDKSLPPEPAQQSVESAVAAPSSAPAESAPVTSLASPLLPEDLRVPWDWADLLLFVLIYICGLFVVGMLVAIVFALLGVSQAQVQNSVTEKNLLDIVIQTVLDLALLGYLAAQMRLRFGLPFWRTIRWRRWQTKDVPRGVLYMLLAFGGFLLGLIITSASAAFPPKGNMPIGTFFQDRHTALLIMAMGILVAPLVEEIVFRGYLYPVLARSFGVWAGVLVTGTLFGLLHAVQLWGGWWQIALLVVVGIVFTFARAVTRTVVTSYLLHVGYNTFQFVAFLIASHGLRHL